MYTPQVLQLSVACLKWRNVKQGIGDARHLQEGRGDSSDRAEGLGRVRSRRTRRVGAHHDDSDEERVMPVIRHPSDALADDYTAEQRVKRHPVAISAWPREWERRGERSVRHELGSQSGTFGHRHHRLGLHLGVHVVHRVCLLSICLSIEVIVYDTRM